MKKAKGHILWADDEIDHLKSHILFLEERGYSITPVSNSEDAIHLIRSNRYDLLLLDEMMPGMDGLQALTKIKELEPALPVIMVTKSEEENLMEEAIGGNIEEYLTKPVNPSQILSTCKRILESRRIVSEKLTRDYTTEFSEILSLLNGPMESETWIDIHLKLSERDVDLDAHPELGLRQSLQAQRKECNHAFGRYIRDHYVEWVNRETRPILSTDLIQHHVIPLLKRGDRVLFIVIDNLRLDQWLSIEPLIYPLFSLTKRCYYSILPTATPYSRNSIFAGLFPNEIESQYPDFWKRGEDDEFSRNRYEHQLLNDQVKRHNLNIKEPKYAKLMDPDEARNVAQNIHSFFSVALSALVFNFVDIVAHRRSDSQILKEIIPDEPAFRSLTKTWFEHSSLFQILKSASENGVTVVITSDHGSIQAKRGSLVYADKETSTNIRYKYGRGIRGESKQILEIKEPKEFGLPQRGINSNYLVALEDYYFVYPTNYHKYLALYRDSFQHGGISLEEMILPIVILESR